MWGVRGLTPRELGLVQRELMERPAPPPRRVPVRRDAEGRLLKIVLV